MSLIESESQTQVTEVGAAPAPKASDTRTSFISPRVVALAWFVAMLVASVVNPATTEAVQPTLVLTILGNVAAFAWLGTLVTGGLNWHRTPTLAFATGGLMLAGHLICGLDGHLPMTGWIWLTQLMAVAGATALSGLALATRR